MKPSTLPPVVRITLPAAECLWRMLVRYNADRDLRPEEDAAILELEQRITQAEARGRTEAASHEGCTCPPWRAPAADCRVCR